MNIFVGEENKCYGLEQVSSHRPLPPLVQSVSDQKDHSLSAGTFI